jgi:drug/metabolite transporter (DMT)-like permease
MLTRTHNTGLLLALVGFAALSGGDAVIKSIAGEWPGTAVAALRYSIGACGLGVLLWVREGRRAFTLPMPAMQILRGVTVAVATLCFFSAIFLMPLAEATAIIFTSPIITAILSAVLLKEKVGKATWIASAIAFIGVLIIMRPNIALLGAAALLPLISAFCMSVMMMANRAVAGAGSPLQMQFLLAVIAAPVLVIAAVAGEMSGVRFFAVAMPDWTVVARCTLVALTATCSHWLVYLATTKATAADIAPMTYIQLPTAMLVGAMLFQDWPDAPALVGFAVIISAGLYLWRSARRESANES